MIDKEKSLAYLYPEVAKEWHPTKNGDLTPEKITYGSGRKIWWICEKGHEWESTVNNRTQGYGCPECGRQKMVASRKKNKLAIKGSLLDVNPNLSNEWHPTKNGKLTPADVTVMSGQKVWWKCSKGHEWKAAIAGRSSGSGCPICANHQLLSGYNDLATVKPELAKEWNYEKNKELTPNQILSGSNKKVWWKCERGHEWQTTVNSRSSGGFGCPYCANTGSSKPEQGIAFYLEQCFDISQRIKVEKQEVDIFIPEYKIGIEYDGIYYHKNKIMQDVKKTNILTRAGITLFRVIEAKQNHINGNNIYYKYDDMGANYEWALKSLFHLVSGIIGDDRIDTININVKRDNLRIRERYALYQKENSFASIHPELINEWNYEKNGTLRPDMFSCNTREKVWWKCSKDHEWKASFADRSKGRGCPICSNKKVLEGFNDLNTINPALAKEWNYDKNGDLTPKQFTVNSGKKVWWICSKGHEWIDSITHRSNGRGCPVCSNHQVLQGYNDLATTNPDLAKEWNYNKNGDLTPNMVVKGSQKKVWWQCPKGHEWEDSIAHRTSGRGCPYCSNHRILIGYNDLATTNPELVKEWNYIKNGDLTPEAVNAGTEKKVWWICENGHEWEALIPNRAKLGSGCPVCAKNKRKKAYER